MKINQFFKPALAVVLISSSFFIVSCEKDARTPPDMSFKTGSTYVSADVTLPMDTTIKVGITATKTEDELNTYNVSYAYDGATTTTTSQTFELTKDDEESYTKDVNITTRSVAGTEKWSFTITDKDGNTTVKSITLTVQ